MMILKIKSQLYIIKVSKIHTWDKITRVPVIIVITTVNTNTNTIDLKDY